MPRARTFPFIAVRRAYPPLGARLGSWCRLVHHVGARVPEPWEATLHRLAGSCH